MKQPLVELPKVADIEYTALLIAFSYEKKKRYSSPSNITLRFYIVPKKNSGPLFV
jgi:hypothetical protein